MHDAAADVHLDVDVHRAALVPAGIDRREHREPVRVRLLDAAQERAARRAAAEARVVAGRVGVPDVDGRALDRLAGRRVQDAQPQRQERTGVAVPDVAPQLLAGDVVRPLGQLGRQHALDGACLDGLVAACARRYERSPPAAATTSPPSLASELRRVSARPCDEASDPGL